MKKFYFAFCSAIILHSKVALGSESGMPQLDPEYWYAQIFWLILIFSSLYLIIWKIFLPKITYSLESRKSRIVNDLNEAQKLKENAKKKLEEYNKIIDNSKKEAKKIIEDNKKRLEKDIELKKQKFNNEIEKELIATEKEIKELKKNSISSINKIATETSSEVIKKVLSTEVNNSSVSAIVGEIVKTKVEKYI
tara:strand:- start:752 stop:1330 length:579 start_codon:yes stop_codon:yes gene_type:complete